MENILVICEIVVGVLLCFVILIQNKAVALNLTSMGGGMGAVTKRGADKILHNATIVLGVCFITLSIALFLVK